MTQHAWTPERVETLKRMWAEGLTAAQIAKALTGTTRNAVLGQVFKHGLQRGGKRTGGRPKKKAAHHVIGSAPRLCPADRAPLRVVQLPVISSAPPSLSVSILALAAGMCRWPEGEGADATYCGHPVKAGKPYCEGHCAAAYTTARLYRQENMDEIAARLSRFPHQIAA